MTAVDRYLDKVGRYVPKTQRADIVRELADDIAAAIEARESELGRPLTADEENVVLQRYGDPLVVAARYRGDRRTLAFGRTLIGPALFPLYLTVLSINLGVTLAICVIVVIVRALAGVGDAASPLPAIALNLLLQASIVTAIFAMANSRLALPDREPALADPLAAVPPFAGQDFSPAHHGADALGRTPPGRVSRFESFAQIVAAAVFLVWLNGMHQSQLWLPARPMTGPRSHLDVGDAIGFGPVWGRVFLPIALVLVASIAQAVVNLWRPEWTRFRAAVHTATSAAAAAIAWFLFAAGNWVVAGGLGRALVARRVALINDRVFFWTLLVVALAVTAALLTDLWRLVREMRAPRV